MRLPCALEDEACAPVMTLPEAAWGTGEQQRRCLGNKSAYAPHLL